MKRAIDRQELDLKLAKLGGGNILDKVYPVGSIYMSVNSTNPQFLFGGTWEQIQDRFLLSAGNSYSAGAIGGEATHILTTTELPSHTHGSKSLTGNITSVLMDDGATISTSGIVSNSTPRQRSWTGTGGNAVRTLTINATHEHSSVGSNEAHNNMPPYLVVYIWKRTN